MFFREERGEGEEKKKARVHDKAINRGTPRIYRITLASSQSLEQ